MADGSDDQGDGPKLAYENSSPLFFFRKPNEKTEQLAQMARMEMLDKAIATAEKQGQKGEAKALRILKKKREKSLEDDQSR